MAGIATCCCQVALLLQQIGQGENIRSPGLAIRNADTDDAAPVDDRGGNPGPVRCHDAPHDRVCIRKAGRRVEAQHRQGGVVCNPPSAAGHLGLEQRRQVNGSLDVLGEAAPAYGGKG